MSDKPFYSQLVMLYGKLLTDKQLEIAELYFSCDLSLGEISEINGITRQSVSDAVKTVRTELAKFEAMLGFKQIFDNLKQIASELDDITANRIMEIIGE